MAIYGSIFLYPENVAIDATQPLTLSCVVDGTLITQYQWRIWNIANNSLVWDSGLVTLPTPLTNRSNLFVTVPLNTMVNGNEYKHSVTTSDGVNSVTSIEVGFITNTNPTITFTIPSTITAPAYKFTPVYTQAQNVGIEYSYFKFYNNIGELILTTDKNYSGDLSYTFSGFDNNLYGVQFLGETYNKVSFQTGIINFGVSYGSPSVNMKLNTSQDKCNGNVTVSWGNMTIVEGYSNGTFQYIENAVGGNYGVHLDANSNIYWNLDISDYFTVKKIWKKDDYEWYDSIAQLEFGDVKYKVGYQYGRFYFDNNGNIGWSDLTPLPNDFIFIIIQRNRVVINNNGVLIPVTFDNLGINTQSKLTTDYVNTATISNVYAGKVNEFNIGGATLNQVIKNGDFANGTTGWSGASILSVNNKVLNVTGSGSSSTVYATYSTSSTSVGKYFCKIRIRVTNANCNSINVYGKTTLLIRQILNPIQNQWYDVYAVINVVTPAVGYYIYVDHKYADATTANGKVMEVDGNVGVFAIPLTGTPYENYTADQINSMLGGYFEGLQSTKQVDVLSRGKNLFDITTLEQGTFSATGDLIPSNTRVRTKKIPIKTIAHYLKSYSAFLRIRAVAFYNKNGNYISQTTESIATELLLSTIPPNAYLIIIALTKPDLVTNLTPIECINEKFMLNEGSTALPYEPYQESTLSVTCNGDFELSKLPNGVQNEVNQVAGYISAVERVKKYELKSGDITNISNLTNCQRILVANKSDSVNLANGINNDFIVPNFPSVPVSGGAGADVANVSFHVFNSFYIQVPLGTYANLAAAQSALAGTVMYYQLATPLTSPYFVTTNGELVLPNTNGNSLTTDANIIPEVGITYYNR